MERPLSEPLVEVFIIWAVTIDYFIEFWTMSRNEAMS